jgi:1,5-anhydro-D-fructose reductase (1,5-anhydro-D-mannitol-forming)
MKVAIVGYGKIGKIRHQICKTVYPDFEYKISDPYINDIKAEDIIDWCDACFICTPNNYNVRYTTYALQHNKHVFCEKPPSRNYDELLQVQNIYNNKTSLIYGFNHRQYDSIQQMKSIIDDASTGKILWIRGRYGKAMGDPNTQGWRADPEKSGGGILLDQGIHMLDLMIYFGGPFDKIQSIVTNSVWNIEGLEDNAFINLYNSKDKIASSLHSTMIDWRHIFSLEVLMENGYLALNGLKTPSGSYGKEILTICDNKKKTDETAESTVIEFTSNTTWQKEINNFICGIINGSNNTNLPDALEVMRVIKEAYNGRL